MRPAFSNALYYPTIDIEDTDWLKTSILFWDSISTIVPESLTHPYNQPDTQYLADIGFLRPLYINSDDKSVVGIEDEILDLLFSREFRKVICSPQEQRYDRIWSDKISYKIRRYLSDVSRGGKYREIMSQRIREQIRYFSRHIDHHNIYYFDSDFTNIYMIVLANKLCEDHSLGMVTNDVPCFNISNTVRFGNQTPIRPKYLFFSRRPKDHQLEQGLLLNFIIRGLSISPDTTLADIVSFKNHHRDELGRFRTQLTKLTQNLDEDRPIEVMQQEISDLYSNEFMPAFNDVKAALASSRIKWFTETFLKVSLLSASATGVPMALLGMPVEQAIFAGMGVSVIASAVSYSIDKKHILRENPYSYLLSINREWT